MHEIECAVCGKRGNLDVLSHVGCFKCGSPNHEAYRPCPVGAGCPTYPHAYNAHPHVIADGTRMFDRDGVPIGA